MQVVRDVDMDVSKRDPKWSITNLGLPLPTVIVLLVQTVTAALWIDGKLAKLDTVIEQQKEIKAEVYHPVSYTHLTLPTKRIV